MTVSVALVEQDSYNFQLFSRNKEETIMKQKMSILLIMALLILNVISFNNTFAESDYTIGNHSAYR